MTRPKGNDHKSVAKYAASYPACHPERNEMESKASARRRCASE